MRCDSLGNPCPATLGEYRDSIKAIFGDDNEAIALLDEKIAEHGRDELVVVSDEQMRAMLFPLVFTPKEKR